MHRNTPLIVLVAAGLLSTASAVVHAGELRGRLDLPKDAARRLLPAPPKAYWEEWNGVLPPAEPRVQAGRYLAVALRGSGTPKLDACGGSLRGGDLLPHTLLVRSGGELRIVNHDGTPHELFAEEMEGFGPLPTAPGNARTVRVPGAGRWTVRDARYPHVQGHVVALDDLVACGRVADDGSVRFSDVPAGRYTLVVFHRGEPVASQPVEVPAEGSVQLDAPLKVALP